MWIQITHPNLHSGLRGCNQTSSTQKWLSSAWKTSQRTRQKGALKMSPAQDVCRPAPDFQSAMLMLGLTILESQYWKISKQPIFSSTLQYFHPITQKSINQPFIIHTLKGTDKATIKIATEKTIQRTPFSQQTAKIYVYIKTIPINFILSR